MHQVIVSTPDIFVSGLCQEIPESSCLIAAVPVIPATVPLSVRSSSQFTVMSETSVLVVAPEPLMRLGLRHFLFTEAKVKHCLEVTSAAEALDVQANLRPTMVVMAASAEAPRLIRDLRRCRPDQRVLVVGRAAEADYVRRVMQAGALGYVTSLDDLAELRLAVASVMSGSLHVSKSAAGGLMMEIRGGAARAESAEPSLSVLSDRELEVFQLVGKGLGCKEIAVRLSISIKTVETHKQRMKDKLSLPNGSELLRLSMAHHARSQSKNGSV